MFVTCWGARGSIATPGPQTQRFGGNTSCLSIELDDAIVILDAGTGIRVLGPIAAASEKDIIIVLSHIHFDHICGFPFFAPIFQKRTLHLVDYVYENLTWSLRDLLDGQYFPATPDMLPATFQRESVEPEEFLAPYGLKLERMAVNHPGGAYGFRLTTNGGSLLYIPDNELNPPTKTVTFDDLAAFCDGADVLIHDAQYQESEMNGKRGWGHSAVEDTARLALESSVGRLLLFHHDPTRSDDGVDEMEKKARAVLNGSGIECEAAQEGMVIEV